MPRRRFTERYNLPSSGGSGAAAAMQMAEQQRRTIFGVRATAPDPLRDAAREAQIARTQSSDAKAQYQLQKEIETDRQKAAFYNGLQELESNLDAQGHKIGSAGHAEAFAAYAHEFPLARSASDVQQTLKLHSQIADDQAALKARMREMSPPPEKAAIRFDRLQGDIANYEALLKGDITRQATANKGTPNVPYNPAFDAEAAKIAGALEASKLESSGLLRSYPQLASPVTSDNNTQPQTQPTAPQTAPVAATPTPTVAPTIDHTAAMDWANSNPNDPRAQVIIQRAQAAIPQSIPETTPQPDEEQ